MIEVRNSAVRTRCEAGHVHSSVHETVDSSDSSFEPLEDEDEGEDVDSYRSAWEREVKEDEEDGAKLSKGAIDGQLDRQDGYGRGRPSEDEVGSDPNNVPVVDPSAYVE